ncbi:hypothetical protein [Microlunatus sp. GCM10028923]|uniref:hypothetical protein n=1 Tax=Microlunatus sp. GCM10028923 TaxID=3273400 RepID=UPI003620E551
MGDTGVEDEKRAPKLPSDARWRERLREEVRRVVNNERLTVEALAHQMPVSLRSLRSWMGQQECPMPTVPTLKVVAGRLTYPVVDQLSDLGVLSAADVSPDFGVSRSILSAQIGRILDAVSMVRPGMTEAAAAVLQSCRDTGDVGVWRSRLFDVAVGRRYQRVGYYGLEVQQWRGTGTGPRGYQPGVSKALRERVERLMPDEADRIMYAGGAKNWSKNTPGVWERAEITWRMRKVLPLVTHNRYGLADWEVHKHLVQSTEPTDRHIFLEAAGSHLAPDPATTTRLRDARSTQSSSLPERLVLLCPPSSGGAALGRLIADGLGWDAVTLQQLAGAITGLPLRVSHMQVRDDELRRALDHIRHVTPAYPTVYAIGIAPKNIEDRLWKSIASLISSGDVMLILLRPSDDTAREWYERQLGLDPISSDEPVKRAQDQLRALDQIAAQVGDGQRAAAGTLVPTMKWSDRDHFESPEIGDYRLRAAYEICHLLVHGQVAGKSPLRWSFREGSALAKFADKLRLDTRGSSVIEWTVKNLRMKAMPT